MGGSSTTCKAGDCPGHLRTGARLGALLSMQSIQGSGFSMKTTAESKYVMTAISEAMQHQGQQC